MRITRNRWLRNVLLASIYMLGILGIVSSGGGGGSSTGTSSQFEVIDIGPTGGDFTLANGIILSIPPGAVSAETTFQFRVVENTELDLPTTYFRQYDKQYLAGFEAKPYGYSFSQPISITIPSVGLSSSTSLPYPLLLDTTSDEALLIGVAPTNLLTAETTPSALSAPITASEVSLDSIEVNADGSITLPDLSALPEDERAVVLLEIEKILAESDCIITPCRCGRIMVESEDFDSSGSSGDDCYSVYSDGYVQYLDCPGQPIEPWSLHESNLDVTVTPSNASIRVDEIAYFSIGMTNEVGQPVTDFLIESLAIEDSSIISEWYIGLDSIRIIGLSPGISSAEVLTASGSCQYKGWLSVEVEESSIVVSKDSLSIPEGENRSVGVKLSDPPGVSRTILVSALVGGDASFSVTSGTTLSFDDTNWDNYQYLLIAAAEDDGDSTNGTAILTLIANPDSYVAENVALTEIDNDMVNFVISKENVTVPEGGSASFLVRLNGDPISPLQAEVIVDSGDPDITITSEAILDFDSSNWNVDQRVVLSAAPDVDTEEGTAQIKISTTTIGVNDRFVSAVEEEYAIYEAALAIEGAEMISGFSWAQWYGVVPVTITTDPTQVCAGLMEGVGQLVYYDAYSLGECFVQETGVINVTVEGSHDCSNPPIYSVGAALDKNTTVEIFCPGSYSSNDLIGNWKNYAVFLEASNGYTEIYDDLYDYYRVQLLNPPN